MCWDMFGGGTTGATGTQTVAGHTFTTPQPVSAASYGGVPTNYASYAAPANYYNSAAAQLLPTSNYASNAMNIARSMGNYGIGTGTATGAARAGASAYTPAIRGSPMGGTMWGKVAGGARETLQGMFGGGKEGEAPWWVKPAMMGAGYLMPQPKSEIPTSDELLAKYQGKSTSPEGSAARSKVLEYINNPEAIGSAATTDYISALNADADAQDAAEMAQFDSAWVGQGYSTTGSDYFKAKQDLMNKQTIRRNTQVGAVRQNVWSTQVQAQLQMISEAYGVDQALLQELMTLDVYTAAQKYGMSVETVNQFRKAIYDMASGINQKNPTEELLNALKG